jgi:hypothetical protein
MSKLECGKSIKYAANRAVPWRTGLQQKFPEDPRNAAAVVLLKQLAVDVDNITDEQFSKLAPHWSWVDELWHETLLVVIRRVGYQRTIKTFDDFVNTLVSYLQRAQAKVAA